MLFDAGYGSNTDFRDEVTALGLTYSAGILSTTSVWAPGQEPLPPKPWIGRGRPPLCLRHDDTHHPVSVKSLALGLALEAWETITWREGSAEPLTSRFARLRVRPAHGDLQRHEPRPEEWLLIEWPEDEPEPTKYWFSTLSESISFADIVNLTKLRWRIERDYQKLKQEVGLGLRHPLIFENLNDFIEIAVGDEITNLLMSLTFSKMRGCLRASVTMKAEVGADFIIMPVYA